MMVKKLLSVIQVLLLLIFVVCAAIIGKYFYETTVAANVYDNLKAQVKNASGEDASGGYEEKRAANGMLAAYYDLYSQNNDMVGWIKIDDTVIDYPVVQGNNNEYYLHRDFYRNSQYCGIPFLDCECLENTQNRIIYAHNMRNGSMFAALTGYEKQDFYESHKIIKYDTLYDRGKYEIISVLRTTIGSKDEFKYVNYAQLEDEQKFNEYVNEVKRLSMINTENTAEYGDVLLTLSTCAYHTSNERIVIVAKLMHDENNT